MKSIILTFIALFFMVTGLRGQWEIVSVSDWIGLNNVYFINAHTGYITGKEPHCHIGACLGAMFYTNDGGETWEEKYDIDFCPLSIWFFSNQITSDQKGFLLGNTCRSSGLYTSTATDTVWELNNTFENVYALFFINNKIGWLVGERSGKTRIYRTINGGERWLGFSDVSGHLSRINSLYFIDESTGWAVGEYGIVLKYTDNDGWKQIKSGKNIPYKKVFFADRNTGWIAGGFHSDDEGFHPILLKTEDGGESWIKIENINYLINDFYFKDKNHGFAVGKDSDWTGVILKTVNGGYNWTVEFEHLHNSLNALYFNDGYYWAVGGALILKMYDSTYTSISERPYSDNSNKNILKNYPNPFSSATVIGYQLPSTADVELSVYDLLGQKVTTLVKKRQQPGSYEVEWNASGMKPGLYWCELKTDQGSKAIKMILIK